MQLFMAGRRSSQRESTVLGRSPKVVQKTRSNILKAKIEKASSLGFCTPQSQRTLRETLNPLNADHRARTPLDVATFSTPEASVAQAPVSMQPSSRVRRKTEKGEKYAQSTTKARVAGMATGIRKMKGPVAVAGGLISDSGRKHSNKDAAKQSANANLQQPNSATPQKTALKPHPKSYILASAGKPDVEKSDSSPVKRKLTAPKASRVINKSVWSNELVPETNNSPGREQPSSTKKRISHPKTASLHPKSAKQPVFISGLATAAVGCKNGFQKGKGFRSAPSSLNHDMNKHQGMNQRDESLKTMKLMIKIFQETRNEANEHNMRVRGLLSEMRDEIREIRVECRQNSSKALSVLNEIRAQAVLSERIISAPGNDNREETKNLPIEFVDASSALMRYVYGSAGKGNGKALHLFPPKSQQEELCRLVVKVLLEFSENGNIDDVLSSSRRIGTSELRPEAKENSMAEKVDKVLSSRLISSEVGSRCVLGENYKGEKKLKNTVADRMLDQRRRYHEFVTPSVISSWMRHANFNEYDWSRSIKMQKASVFEAAADALEQNSRGLSAYQNPQIYGQCYRAACDALRQSSQSFAAKALGYVQKVVPNGDRFIQALQTCADEIRQCTLSRKRNLSDFYSTEHVYGPHQISFVFTKITSRLETLSKCKIKGGQNGRNVEKGHLADFLENAVGFDKYAGAGRKKLKRLREVQVDDEHSEMKILGVRLKPFCAADRRDFSIALYGSAMPADSKSDIEDCSAPPGGSLPSDGKDESHSTKTFDASKDYHNLGTHVRGSANELNKYGEIYVSEDESEYEQCDDQTSPGENGIALRMDYDEESEEEN